MIFGFDRTERERVLALRGEDRFFWLDISLRETSPDDLVRALDIPESAGRALWGGEAGAAQAFHSDGDSVVFALRCYAGSETAAAGATHNLRPLRVWVLVTAGYLLTLHEENVSLPAALGLELPEERSRGFAVYAVLDGMLATTFRALEEVELTLDEVAERWSDDGERGARAPRSALRDCTRRLATMRRWVGGQQADFERVGVEIAALRGFESDQEPDFDRLDGQLDRLLASIDAAASAMGMLLDLQLNERAFVVSVIAAIFVPLTFITGYFGMNFGWMVDQVDTQVAFWLLGFLVPIATGLLVWLLVRRLLIGDSRQPARR